MKEILIAILASSGCWAFFTAVFQHFVLSKKTKDEAREDEKTLLLGLAHDRIYSLCREYIERGSVTVSEYDNLLYIYRPYSKSGGNGTGRRLFAAVENLPLINDVETATEDLKNE